MSHFKWGCQLKDLSADISDPNDTQGSASNPLSHKIEFFPPASVSGQSILDQQLMRESQEQRNCRNRDRPSNSIRSNRQQYACLGTRGDIDVIVTDAKPGDDG